VFIDRDFAPHSRHDFFNALGEESFDCEIHAGKLHERVADFGLNTLRLFSAQWDEIRVDLAVMCSPRVVRLLRAPHALSDGTDMGILLKFPGDLFSNRQRLLERRARNGGHVNDEMAFAQFGKEFAAEEGKHGERDHAQRGDAGEDRLRMGGYPFKSVTVLAPQVSEIPWRVIHLYALR